MADPEKVVPADPEAGTDPKRTQKVDPHADDLAHAQGVGRSTDEVATATRLSVLPDVEKTENKINEAVAAYSQMGIRLANRLGDNITEGKLRESLILDPAIGQRRRLSEEEKVWARALFLRMFTAAVFKAVLGSDSPELHPTMESFAWNMLHAESSPGVEKLRKDDAFKAKLKALELNLPAYPLIPGPLQDALGLCVISAVIG